jgi:quercetin dioxygenase-like cupin family protein
MSTSAPQVEGLKRTDIQEHDLSVPGHEVIQNRVEISPEATPFKHFHHGEEISYVLEGELEWRIQGESPRRVKAGEALIVPAKAVHGVKNVGSDGGVILATYVVEKDKPLITLVE